MKWPTQQCLAPDRRNILKYSALALFLLVSRLSPGFDRFLVEIGPTKHVEG